MILDFLFLGKRRIVQFLARIWHDYQVLFWIFWYIINVILSIFPLFWHFLDTITLKSRVMVGNRNSRHLLLLVIHWQYSGSNTRRDNISHSNSFEHHRQHTNPPPIAFHSFFREWFPIIPFLKFSLYVFLKKNSLKLSNILLENSVILLEMSKISLKISSILSFQ